MGFPMPKYKRNQVEEAISRVLEPRSREPTAALRTRLKRLLETDRALGLVPRSADPEQANFAFYSSEAPGSGVEVWFSDYEAFALLNGLRLMGHGWPQSFAVSVMRRVRRELEKEHAHILNQDPGKLFDQDAIRRAAKEAIWRSMLRTQFYLRSFLSLAQRRVKRPSQRHVRYAEDRVRR
jgi:hypothetical protein